MKIAHVTAVPLSYRYKELPMPLATGQSYKRDTVIVRVRDADGAVGYGEAYHGKAPTAMAELINTTLADLVVGEEADNTEGIWTKVFRRQVRGAGTGAAAMAGLGGIDMALWDLRGKRLGVPVYRLLGGERRAFRAYAGGIRLGFQPPEQLAQEVTRLRELGYTAVKIRLGDSYANDMARLRRVREEVGDDFDIMVDINLGYSFDEMYRLLPVLGECAVTWVEEPFERTDVGSLRQLRRRSPVPVATGEHLFGVHEFLPLLQAEAVDFLQPDPSSGGGITELKKIGDLAKAFHVRFAPHISNSRLNHAAVLHVMSAVSCSYIFEADATDNRFAEALCTAPLAIDAEGLVRAPDAPGLGVEVDESLFAEFPAIAGSPHLQDRPR
ncbi:mandelate racemase/muconate lactonizing enzyme family protein [Phytohabitans sp. ZYX-F-186]|uniref:Mandelate racemase/muconate lactonizing enzyme family protein n=1 Tax=Phytohabitans maris TaxID=3071409 RepID=A0ABU0ZCU7_9ACTN|nr:mandelate racemase/muconate lactonizing enzyme family protein [Phytohabitans sp. ZYX-F-186]MDQ7904793.1 mandelate racemase/muconate lactonizing enzyme family protein [Phytohabitans sp. ZYX-F-186]